MSQTVRILRIALPIAFFGFVVVLIASWNRPQKQANSRVATPVSTTRPSGDQPNAEAIAFEDVQTIGNRVVSRIRANRVVSHVSGWSTLEGVHLTIFRANGLTYELSCPQAQYNAETKEADVKGGVRLTSNDGMEVSTAEMHFDGSSLTNRVPVEFRVDRWSGKGGGLNLDVPGETLRLVSTVNATMAPSLPAEAPLTIDSAEALFRRKENDVTFSDDVVMNRGADRMTGDRVVGKFTADRKTLLGIEGNGDIVMTLAQNPAPGENLGGRKQITSDRFFSEVSAEGQISAINAVGEGKPARAILDGPPRRDIEASSFRIAIAGRAVRELKAEGHVIMIEIGPERREIRVDRSIIAFDPVQNRATSAFLDGNFKYRDPRTTASSIRAHYDIAGDRVILTAEPGFDPTIVSDGQTLKAKQIELSPKAGIAKATGEVIAELVGREGGPSADTTNVFPAGKPVFVNADLLVMRQAAKTAHFTGNVRAWQDLNTLFAAEMQVQGAGQVLTARGDVRTALYNTGAEARKSPMRSKSQQLIARRNDRQLELAGNVEIQDETRTVTAEKAIVYFDAQRKVERVEAEEKVVLVEKAMNRKGTGEKAVYQVKQKTAYLSGSPATATDPQGSLSGERIEFDLSRNRVQVLSPTSQTKGTFKQP